MTISFYGMSESYSCPKALAARKLGYEPEQSSPENEESLKYYTRLEAIAAQKLLDEGYMIEPSSLCLVCKNNYNIERYGIHTEIETPLFNLIGHMDRRVLLNDNNRTRIPVEIKCLGKASWSDFQKNQFENFMPYAGQETCYLESEHQPGIYWVMNRDSGKVLRYIVNDSKNELTPENLPHFEKFAKIELPVTFAQVLDNLNITELCVRDNTLPDVNYEEHKCQWCHFSYLCTKSIPAELKLITKAEVVSAVESYKKGKELEEQSKELVDSAKEVLINYAKSSGETKFKSAGGSISYLGTRQGEYPDMTKLRELVPSDTIAKIMRKGKIWEDLRVRFEKEGD